MSPTSDKLKREALAQIEIIEKRFQELSAKDAISIFGNKGSRHEWAEFNAMCLTAIERIAGKQHTHSIQARETILEAKGVGAPDPIQSLYGIVKALKRDVENDYLIEFSEIEHASLFADFLEMGDYLLEQGYKDPAAVLIGGVLESHLRQLSLKNGLPIADQNAAGKSIPRKAETLNTELARNNVYGKLEQKTVTGWLDLRNKAAHALYPDYKKEQVELFSQGLALFMVQYPA